MTGTVDPQELIGKFERCGATLTVAGDKIKIRAPSAPPSILMEELRENKALVIEYLRARVAQPTEGEAPSVACFHCVGTGSCDCIACGRYAIRAEWVAGDCLACQTRKRKAEQIQ